MIINNNIITAVRIEEWNNEACMKVSEIQCHVINRQWYYTNGYYNGL